MPGLFRTNGLVRALPRTSSSTTWHASTRTTTAAVATLMFRRGMATPSSIPQTLIEKIVQDYAVDLPAGKKVKSGDYVMIRPEHV